ncbi:MAG: HAD family hydrolase [Planctomycetota bacterium]
MKGRSPAPPSDAAFLIERIRALASPMDPVPTGVLPKLRLISGIRAVLLDVYGTLVISGSGEAGSTDPRHMAGALREALRACGSRGDLSRPAERGAVLFAERIRAHHESALAAGISFPEIEIRSLWSEVLRALGEEGLLQEEDARLSLDRLAVEFDCRANPVWPMPGAGELLALLRARGLALGIVSNSQFYTPLLLEALFRAPLEALGIAADLCGWSYLLGEAKPSPALFRGALAALADRFRVQPHETLYIGNDMLNDVRTAQGMGCRAALFAGDARSLRLRRDDPSCRDLRPDAIVTSLHQVGRIVGEPMRG